MARMHPPLHLHLPLLLPVILATTLLVAASASATTAARKPAQAPTTNPVALSLRLAERYWHGTPACGTPTIALSSRQLPDSGYERVTSPEPADSVVEMWTDVQTCTITINASLWPGWHQDDEFFQWFCDAMTHEVGHLFGYPDSGQTNPALITYPFLSSTSPNFNSVPACKNVPLRYGSQEIRNEEVFSPH